MFLFLLTCLATFWAGSQVGPGPVGIASRATQNDVFFHLRGNWTNGLIYMTAVMAILLAHEMGHFLQALRYRVPASLPFFIPMPLTPIGTMGAVIGMQGSAADRRQMFDIGISGPLAGLVVCLPILVYGIATSHPFEGTPGPGTIHFGDPLLLELLIKLVRPDLPWDTEMQLSPLMLAGWVGLLVTGLNMLPISQLDGGHVAYALLGKKAHLLARVFLLASVGVMLVFNLYQWTVMLILVTLIGTDHPPTRDDTVPLGPWRKALGYASLAIPIFCMAPIPISAASM